MIAVDTNILVRLLTADGKRQHQRARKLIASQCVFVDDSVILETARVLEFGYAFAADEITDAFALLFGLDNVTISAPAGVAKALDWHRAGMDFADALHLARSQHCDELHTFDRAFVKSAKGQSDCIVMPA